MDLERLAMFIQKKESIFDLDWNDKGVKYKDICLQNEIEQSYYNFTYANTDYLKKQFSFAEEEAKYLINEKLVYPSYEKCIKASHFFNLIRCKRRFKCIRKSRIYKKSKRYC